MLTANYGGIGGEGIPVPQRCKVLSQQIEAIVYKFIYMILLAGKTLPLDGDIQEIRRDFVDLYNSKANWRVQQVFEEELKRHK